MQRSFANRGKRQEARNYFLKVLIVTSGVYLGLKNPMN